MNNFVDRPPAEVERDLLYGHLAVRGGHIDIDKYITAYRAWISGEPRPLGDVLRECGPIDASVHADIQLKVEMWRETCLGEDRSRQTEAERAMQTKVGETNPSGLRATAGGPPSAASSHLDQTLVMPNAAEDCEGVGQVGASSTSSRYTMSHVHGEGSLGRVWLARDHDLNREVALKELRPGVTGSPEKVCMFLKEAQVTGQLEHPNIVPVYELARRPQDGQPFYTMRFIRGRTLGEAIAEYHKNRRAGSAGRLEFARLLARFYGICYAVGYAHSRGVIHRDLKPENVVLGDYGEVNVVDWGLAKLVATSRDSREPSVELGRSAMWADECQGRVMGTPAYMAPEQAEGRTDRLDARTDIYGLGSILFEILTGRPPHGGSGPIEVLEGIVDGETPLARSVEPSVHPALEAVCARAMAKDPGDRYQEAGAVALDLQRFMNDEPVSVYAEPPIQRLARWARRHRAWTQAGAAALVLVSIVSTIAALLVGSAWRAEELARREADDRYILARSFADTLLSSVGEDLKDVPGAEGVRRKILEKAAEAYQRFADERSTDPVLQLKSGLAQLRIAEVLNLLHDIEGALKACGEAEAIFLATGRLTPGDPEPPRLRAESLAYRGRVLNGNGRNVEARESYKKAMDALEPLLRRAPHDPVLLDRRASCAVGMALVLQELGEPADSERNYLAAIRDYDHLIRDAGAAGAKIGHQGIRADPSYRVNRSRGLINFATLLDEKDRKEEAESLCLRAIDDLEHLVQDEPDVPDHLYNLAACQNLLGLLLRDRGQGPQAQKAFLQAVDRYETLVYKKAVPKRMHGLVQARTNLAVYLTDTDDRAAEALIRAGIHDATILVKMHPGVPDYLETLSECWHSLAMLFLRRQDRPQAIRSLDQAIQARRKMAALPDKSADVERKLGRWLWLRCHTNLELKRVAAALGDLEEFPKFLQGPEDQYNAACEWSMASALVEGEERRRYGERALGFLGRAISLDRELAAGLAEPPDPKHDPDLDPIRHLPGFRAIRESLRR